MAKWPLRTLLVLSLAGCAAHSHDIDNKLTAALAEEPVVITQEHAGFLGGIFNEHLTITLTSSADYIYPPGGFELKPGAPVLSKMVPIFRRFTNTHITVVGYTDNTPVGPQLQRMGIADNVQLSLKRASEAVAYFQSQGVEPFLLSAKGFGDADPVASNDTPEGRARNRRISIVLTGDLT